MTKAEIIEDLLAEVVPGGCPAILREQMEQVLSSFSMSEARLFHVNADKFAVTSDSDPTWDDLCYGKLFLENGFYYLNIFPATLEESPTDIRYVICHEFGHLRDELQGVQFDDDLWETRADEFACGHGFRPEKLKMLSGFAG